MIKNTEGSIFHFTFLEKRLFLTSNVFEILETFDAAKFGVFTLSFVVQMLIIVFETSNYYAVSVLFFVIQKESLFGNVLMAQKIQIPSE